MNICGNALRNLKVFIKTNNIAFVILVIGMITSVITFVYTFVRIDYYNAITSTAETDLSEIVMSKDTDITLSPEISERLAVYCSNNDFVKYVYANISVTGNEDFDEYSYLICDLSDNNNYFADLLNTNIMYSGKWFSNDELKESSPVCVLSGMNYSEISEVFCGSTELNVVGIMNESSPTCGYVPLSTVEKNNIPVSYITFKTASSNMTYAMLEAFVNDISDSFPEFKVQSELSKKADDKAGVFDSENTAMLCMGIIASVNVAYLYIYVLKRKLKIIYVYKLSGVKNSTILAVFIAEFMMIIISAFLAAVLLFQFCIYPVISERDIAFALGLSLKHYVASALSMLIIFMITVCPVAVYYIKKNTVEIFKSIR